jgi:predicted nuclease of predicted toxin-antitoxin system
MKILVDENIPSITVQELRRLGHDVLDVRGTPQQGIEDVELWRLAQFQERLLITN